MKLKIRYEYDPAYASTPPYWAAGKLGDDGVEVWKSGSSWVEARESIIAHFGAVKKAVETIETPATEEVEI